MTWKPAKTLRRLRALKGLTQIQLADALGVHRVTVATWESGRYRPSVELLPRLAKTLGVEIGELLK